MLLLECVSETNNEDSNARAATRQELTLLHLALSATASPNLHINPQH